MAWHCKGSDTGLEQDAAEARHVVVIGAKTMEEEAAAESKARRVAGLELVSNCLVFSCLSDHSLMAGPEGRREGKKEQAATAISLYFCFLSLTQLSSQQ